MNAVQNHWQRHVRRRGEFKNTERLVGPEVLVGGDVPPEAACTTQLLGFGQVCFASANCLVRIFTFGDVDDRSHNVLVACFLPNAMRKRRLQPSLHCREHRIPRLLLRSASTLDRPAVRTGVETSAFGSPYSL